MVSVCGRNRTAVYGLRTSLFYRLNYADSVYIYGKLDTVPGCLISNGRHLRHHSSAFLGINYCALIAALGRALSASLSLLFSGDSPRRAYGPRLPWFLFLAFASLVATGFKPCASPRCQCSLLSGKRGSRASTPLPLIRGDFASRGFGFLSFFGTWPGRCRRDSRTVFLILQTLYK